MRYNRDKREGAAEQNRKLFQWSRSMELSHVSLNLIDQTLAVYPLRPRDGLVIYTKGTGANGTPIGGEGLYCWYANGWHKLTI